MIETRFEQFSKHGFAGCFQWCCNHDFRCGYILSNVNYNLEEIFLTRGRIVESRSPRSKISEGLFDHYLRALSESAKHNPAGVSEVTLELRKHLSLSWNRSDFVPQAAKRSPRSDLVRDKSETRSGSRCIYSLRPHTLLLRSAQHAAFIYFDSTVVKVGGSRRIRRPI